MVKWWWKLDTQDGIWQEIVKARYLKNQTVATVKPRFSDSPCWKALLKVREFYMMGRKIKLQSGNLVRLWKDSIEGLPPLCEQFCLFAICNEQDCTISRWGDISVSSFFRRRLNPVMAEQWHELCDLMNTMPRSPKRDYVYWGLN